MDWVKLTTNYYLDAAVMRAGEAAEVLFTRALAYCGDQENGGVVPREVLPRLTPTRGVQRARALVREGIWEETEHGWRFVRWEKHQTSKEQLDQHREAAKARQAALRARRRNGVTHAVTHADVTHIEVEGEVDAAAAAARHAPPAVLPPAVEILRSALEAHKLTVRWDTLTADQVAEVEHLVDLHGDAVLVQAALRAYQPSKPPVYAAAWLAGWRHLRQPGRLAAVQADPCDRPGHTGTTARCAQCASERGAVDDDTADRRKKGLR